MKSYLQGLITGGVFVFAFFTLTAQSDNLDLIESIKQEVSEEARQKKGQAVINILEEKRRMEKLGLDPTPIVGKYQMIIDKNNSTYLFDTQTGAYYRKNYPNIIDSKGLWKVQPVVPALGVISD